MICRHSDLRNPNPRIGFASADLALRRQPSVTGTVAVVGLAIACQAEVDDVLARLTVSGRALNLQNG